MAQQMPFTLFHYACLCDQGDHCGPAPHSNLGSGVKRNIKYYYKNVCITTWWALNLNEPNQTQQCA